MDDTVRAMTPSLKALLACLAVLASTVSSGTLECDPVHESREIAHGREIYGRMCAVCHGAAGEGYKADQAPALGNQAFLGSVTDAFLTNAITHGRAGSTMSAWGMEHGGPLPPEEVATVVQFLRTWQVGPPTPLDDRPLEGDSNRGQELYARHCLGCHGPKGVSGQYETIGSNAMLSAPTGFLRQAIQRGRDHTLMRGFHETLGDQGVDDVISVLRTWQAGGSPQATRLATPAKPPPLPLGPVPLNPRGPEPVGFDSQGGLTKADVVHAELVRGARMAILDARAPSDYTGEHIAGAVSVPFYAPEPYFKDLPKDAWLVAYCGCPHAESGQLANKLRANGFKKVTVIDEGLRYWSSHKYGLQRGTLP